MLGTNNREYVHGKFFRLVLPFVGKPPSPYATTLLANIRIAVETLGTNTLAYFATASVTKALISSLMLGTNE